MERKSGPDEEYLKISLEESGRVGDADADTDARHLIRKLLVLDLNGTLVYRSPHRPWRDRYPVHGGAAAAVTEEDVYAQFDPTQPRPIRTVHPRPYLTAFREYLFHPSTRRWLDTMVWSSAQPHSVGDMVEKCFGDRKGDLVAIWARDRLGLSDGDYGRKVQTTKDLNKPWDELNSTSVTLDPSLSSPTVQKRNHSAKTTLLLDDSPLKAHLQPYNHLCLKEYDLEMRKQDMAVRELEVARTKLADVIAGKENIEDVLRKHKPKDESSDVGAGPDLDETDGVLPEDTKSPTQEGIAPGEESTGRKRKRKEKKENKKKERIEQQLKKLAEQNENPTWVYDETLLAVVGVLDAVKRESNVAAWIRSGSLIKSLIEEGDRGKSRQTSVNSEGTAASTEEHTSPKKKTKLSEDGQAGPKSLKKNDSLDSVVSNHPPPRTSSPPPRTSSPPRESSPVQEEDKAESETERTGVPLGDTQKGTEGGAKSAEEQLWFNHPGTLAYWATRGRGVLENMGIEFPAGVVGSTG
ncbi:hypothetical protein P691DRAFT_371419 [Macrolepiota fuliginosa MF-IS2]|uniref:Mitochondrial import inner membrane translocase subunit TIM50 n=1 Tax=Macrolepiota fuliginosa MF-IS2 TaxID=1400762 RepID=A0A9P5X3M6_9AGAR|nr:hypothetical protein P691DRAFT_371419 [Macrolepiota fuliginosa MF-IS2]